MAHNRFSLFRFRSPLLTESRLFSLPVGTEMFHFPTLPLSALCVQTEMMGHDSHRVSPFGNPRIKALLAAPRGFSQPHTTFFGFWCLGIRHLHLIIFLHFFCFLKQRCSRSLCSSQDTGEPRNVSRLIKKINQFDLLTRARGFVPSGPNNVHETFRYKIFSTPKFNKLKLSCTNDLF